MRRRASIAGALALFCAAGAPAVPAADDAGSPASRAALPARTWDEAFSTRGAKEGLSLGAVVVDRDGKEHRVRLFRDGEELLARSRAEARVIPLDRAEERTRFGPCRWSEVAGQGVRVCWSSRLKVPLAVEEKRPSGWARSLRIEELKTGPLAASVFEPPEGLREIDLDEQAGPGAD